MPDATAILPETLAATDMCDSDGRLPPAPRNSECRCGSDSVRCPSNDCECTLRMLPAGGDGAQTISDTRRLLALPSPQRRAHWQYTDPLACRNRSDYARTCKDSRNPAERRAGKESAERQSRLETKRRGEPTRPGPVHCGYSAAPDRICWGRRPLHFELTTNRDRSPCNPRWRQAYSCAVRPTRLRMGRPAQGTGDSTAT